MDVKFGLKWLLVMTMCVFVSLSGHVYNGTEDIYALCPYSDICNRNATLHLQSTSDIPCCSSCSCSEDCGLHINCCYEAMDKYRLVDTMQMTCVSLGMGEGEEVAKRYYMIDTCLNAQANVSTSKCREQTEGLNGTTKDFAPVSSLDTHLIYVNSECAICNNVYKYTTWNYQMTCNDDVDIMAPNNMIQYYITHNMCSKVYVEPVLEDWRDRKCFTFEKEICEMADPWLRKMCQLIDLPFTYATNRTFKNIYCAMCESVQTDSLICNDNVRSPSSSFSTIIDSQVGLDQLRSVLMEHHRSEQDDNDKGCQLDEVANPNVLGDCKYIYCPVGMHRVGQDCVYFTSRWITSFYTVLIELTQYSGTRLKMSHMKLLNDKDRKNPKRWIRSPCIAKMTSIQVVSRSLEDMSQSDIINSLILRLLVVTKDGHGFDPSIVVPYLRDCLQQKWMLTIGANNYWFKADLNKYATYPSVDGIVNSMQPPYPYELISSGPRNMLKIINSNLGLEFLFKKLHFCEQVRLRLSEVEYGDNFIRILSHDLELGDNEYIEHVTFDEELFVQKQYTLIDNLTTFAVCLEDFNGRFWKQRQHQQNSIGACIQKVNCACSTIVFILMFIKTFFS